jgi:hypothetical protein
MNLQFLKEKGACCEGVEWWIKKGSKKNIFEVINDLKKEKRYKCANWLLTHSFSEVQNVSYAIFAAEQVLSIFEKKYPQDNRPRKAIEAAKAWLKEPTEGNRIAANAAAYAAAYAAANAAAYAANAAAYAAYAANAANAANAAAYATNADAYAAYAAYDAYDAYAAYEKLQIKIINFGIEILKRDKK